MKVEEMKVGDKVVYSATNDEYELLAVEPTAFKVKDVSGKTTWYMDDKAQYFEPVK